MKPSFLNACKIIQNIHAEKKKKEDQKTDDGNECKVFGCLTDKCNNTYCTMHHHAPYRPNVKTQKHIIVAKLERQDHSAHLQNAKILKKLEGPICKLCQTTDIDKFREQANTVTGYHSYCKLCACLCLKHSDLTQEKRCYNTTCKYCKREGKYQKFLCNNGECEIIVLKSRYGEFCMDCYFVLHPDQAKIHNNKIKEKHFAKQLQIFNEKHNNFLDTKLETQLRIVATDAEDVRRVIYPDFCYEKNDRILFIEFDENQHKNKRYQDDYNKLERSKLIREHAAKNNKVGAILRFNPDSYESKEKKKIASCFKQDATGNDYLHDEEEFQSRFRYFTAQLEHYMQCDLEDLPKEDVLMFFDGFDTDLLLSSGCKSKLDAI